MSTNTFAFQSGDAKITLINTAYVDWNFPRGLGDVKPDWWPQVAPQFDPPVWSNHNVVHIALADASILVDAGLDDLPDSPYQPPDFRRITDLTQALALAGVTPDDITHVVITHAHDDHFGGLTVKQDGAYTPRFPNARVYLGRRDWDDNPDHGNPDEVFSYTLDVVERQGRLALVEGDLELAPGVTILAAPGETPGHQVVRVHSHGETFYVLGDLFHHPAMVEFPWVNRGRDAQAVLASRAWLAEAALREHARLVAYHIDGVGRLARTATGMRWETVSDEQVQNN